MRTILRLYVFLLPLGLSMLATILILKHFTSIDSFMVGFFEGMSTVFIVVGAAISIGAWWGKKGTPAQ